MDDHARILRDYGWFHGIRRKPAIRVLLPEELESYSLTGNADFPRISRAEIEDKSKGDAISKGVAILQTGWFATQCIARGVQGLPITELELVTVAFAALNFVIYLLWWDKPLHVQRGVRVYKKRRTEESVDDGDIESTVGFWVALGDAISGFPTAIARLPSDIENTDDIDSGLERVLMWLVWALIWAPIKPMYIMLAIGGDLHHEGDRKRVDTFYPAKWAASLIFPFFLMIVIMAGFGGIHCIGWSFTFPSSTERALWRVASLSITVVHVAFIAVVLLIGKIDTFLFENCSAITIILLLSLYLLSRLALLVLPFLCLRSLPPAAFHVVHWASFIPHVQFTLMTPDNAMALYDLKVD